MSNKFDFNDFLKQWQTMNNMGGTSMMKLLPGFNKVGRGEGGGWKGGVHYLYLNLSSCLPGHKWSLFRDPSIQ